MAGEPKKKPSVPRKLPDILVRTRWSEQSVIQMSFYSLHSNWLEPWGRWRGCLPRLVVVLLHPAPFTYTLVASEWPRRLVPCHETHVLGLNGQIPRQLISFRWAWPLFWGEDFCLGLSRFFNLMAKGHSISTLGIQIYVFQRQMNVRKTMSLRGPHVFGVKHLHAHLGVISQIFQASSNPFLVGLARAKPWIRAFSLLPS